MEANFDTSLDYDNLFFYFEHETYTMKAYRFNNSDSVSWKYILLKQEELIESISFPKVRKWY